ncbi:hypothetical protein LEP1GSC086_1644 [Leptospira weilii str. LNT 1234]|nr:hypothetical protein LEP1GSC086_1644 [Leptospira weilii str. LNT 1234]
MRESIFGYLRMGGVAKEFKTLGIDTVWSGNFTKDPGDE